MSSQEPPKLTLLIPAFNESLRLPSTLNSLAHWIDEQDYKVEVLLADDGSNDETITVAQQAYPAIKIASLGVHTGAGAAFSYGVTKATGDYILLYDADGATPISEINKLWPAINQGYDIVCGSRKSTHLSSPLPASQPLHRIIIGKVWGRTVRYCLPTQIYDTQCGFKLYTRPAAQAIFLQVQSNGFAFHVESLALAMTMGYLVTEVCITWNDKPGSRIRLLHDPPQMLGEMLDAALRLRVKPYLINSFNNIRIRAKHMLQT